MNHPIEPKMTRASMRTLRKMNREAGLCHCGNHLPHGRRTCAECKPKRAPKRPGVSIYSAPLIDVSSTWLRNFTGAFVNVTSEAAKKRESRRLRHMAAIQNLLCIRCGMKLLSTGKKSCALCLEKYRVAANAYNASKAARRAA